MAQPSSVSSFDQLPNPTSVEPGTLIFVEGTPDDPRAGGYVVRDGAWSHVTLPDLRRAFARS